MGIFELLILIAAAIIFIILVRRFPETAEHVHTPEPGETPKRRSFALPALKLPQIKPRGSTTPTSPLPFEDIPAMPASALSKTTQSEPGASAAELERLAPPLRTLLSEAGEHFEKGDMWLAEDMYIKAAALDPACVMAYHRLGMIYLKNEATIDDAEEALYQALKYAPDNGYIYNNLGLIAYKKGKFNEAVKFYDSAIAADGTIAERHANVGNAYLSLRQYNKAIRFFARAWALEPLTMSYKELLDDAKDRERRQRSARV